MTYIITLVASHTPLNDDHINMVKKITGAKGVTTLKAAHAVDIPVNKKPDDGALDILSARLKDIDIFVTPKENRRKKLLLADMDSTIVYGETLDDLAEHAGLKDKIAAITMRAMNGELDFHAAIKERVHLLKGLSTNALQETLDNLQINPGAEMLVKTMRESGAHCVLVSGGFTFFTHNVAEELGFHNHHGNTLGIEGDALTGTVTPPILDKHAKVEFLKLYMSELNLTADEILTIGDGANDIPMLEMAGLGIGYQPKPAVAQSIDNLIIHGDLTAALYAQGFIHDEIIE